MHGCECTGGQTPWPLYYCTTWAVTARRRTRRLARKPQSHTSPFLLYMQVYLRGQSQRDTGCSDRLSHVGASRRQRHDDPNNAVDPTNGIGFLRERLPVVALVREADH